MNIPLTIEEQEQMKVKLIALVGEDWKEQCTCCKEDMSVEKITITSRADDKRAIWYDCPCGGSHIEPLVRKKIA